LSFIRLGSAIVFNILKGGNKIFEFKTSMNIPKNIIITGGGKWVGIVLQFKKAMQAVKPLADSQLFIASMEKLTPAGCFVDGAFQVPPVKENHYVEHLLEICLSNEVGIIIPLMDIDLLRLAPYRSQFNQHKITLLCPPEALVKLCSDKQNFYQYCQKQHLNYPRLFKAANIQLQDFPLYYKPRFGFGSLSTGVLYTPEQLKALLTQNHDDLLFQEYLSAPEISIDALISINHTVTFRVPRQRDKIVAGEVYKSHTVDLSDITELADKLLQCLASEGYVGPLNLQIFASTPPMLIEVNPRLGSGSVLSNAATEGRFFAAILAEACGQVWVDSPNNYIVDLSLYRYLGDVFYKDNKLFDIIPK